MSHTRRDFLRAAGLWMGAAAWPGRAAAAQAKPPNIVFIMSDDHAAHALSCYGSRINKTPNLDRLAKEGMKLDNCFVTNSICAPSRAVILTGKYSHLNSVKTNRDRFDGSQVTFPKLLRKAGYQTAMVGKWHLKTEPTGFDYWNVLPGQGAYHNPVMIEMGERKKLDGYVTDLITDAAIAFVKGRDPAKPFCLMYHHKAPHRRWEPDAKHADLYKAAPVPTPATFDDDHSGHGTAAKEAEMRIDKHLTPQDVKQDPPEGLSAEELKQWKYQRYMQDYLACVASVDDNVGRFLDVLDAEGLRDDTLVVYTSDQGFFLGDHNWFDKRFMYEESLRMPFLARYPAEIPAGSTQDALALNLDFAPTFLDYAGVAAPGFMQGRSLRPILRGAAPKDWRTAMYYHYYEYPGAHMVRKHYGVRTDRYKLIRYYGDVDEWELFDLEKDPNELASVYGDPEYAAVADGLKAKLEVLRAQYGDEEG